MANIIKCKKNRFLFIFFRKCLHLFVLHSLWLCVSIQFGITLNQIIHGNVNYTSFFSYFDAFCVAFYLYFLFSFIPSSYSTDFTMHYVFKQEILKPDEVSNLQTHCVCYMPFISYSKRTHNVCIKTTTEKYYACMNSSRSIECE